MLLESTKQNFLYFLIKTTLFHRTYFMIKTKIKKAIALASIATIATATLGTTFAATDIGTATVSGSGAFDSNVVWDDAFPGFATGSVTGIVVTAQVEPMLNMTLSDSTIDLGTLVASVASNGSIDIEVGTNAVDGVSITARSTNGGLENTTDGLQVINDVDADGEAYTFESASNAIDSTISGFATTWDLAAVEVNDNTTEHTIYTTNKPELDDEITHYDVTFTVSAESTAQTAAGDYEDTITFTVTGNF